MAQVNLTQQEIDYISRVVDTEVPPSLARTNPAEYERMVQGVVDTITNRTASGQFPNTPVGVMNQDRQFSKISGPSYLDPYGSVQNAPKASQRAQDAVYDYVAARAQGAPATVGGALNYANPNFSSQRNLDSWINPMIENGAQMFGVGNSVHYHGNAPGMEPVGPYGLTAEGMPSGNIPTPTFREDVPGQAASATGIMAAIDPPTPTAVERGGLLDAPTPSAPYDMSLFGWDEPSFDMGRFGPEPTTSPERTASVASAPAFDMGRFGPEPTAAPTSFFDYGRFGPEITQPAAAPSALFDADRFGPQAPVAQGMAGLQRGLLDQQLNVGILPNIPAPVITGAIPNVTQPAVTQPQPAKTYRDPVVSAQPARPAQPIGGTPTRAPGVGQPAAAQFMGRNNPALHDLGPTGRGLLGGLGGAILGGALLGPIGGLMGGLLGRSTFGNPESYFPSAPDPIPGQSNPGYGYDGLSDYGVSAYNESQDFRDAVDSGSVGLW